MEPSNDKKSSVYDLIDDFKSKISTFLGVIVAVVGIVLVILISSLEGTKEIKASNRDSASILEMWREQNEEDFPEHKVGTINYKNKEYYFVVSSFGEDGKIEDWYFAYDSGFGYMFKDWKFYILTYLTIMVAIYVSMVNYTTSKNQAMNGVKFLKTLNVYQVAKERVKDITQYIPDFCSYKNSQLYEETKREIVESLDINYDLYKSNKFDFNTLEKWQQDGLEEIKRIKITRINSSDLLREKSSIEKRKSLLPISPEEHEKRYMIITIIQKVLSSILSGLTVGLGVVLGNIWLGLAYGFVVFLSFITSNIAGSDYSNSSLRQRYIGKADLLNEFYNMKDFFIEKRKKEEEALKEEPIEEIIIEKEEVPLKNSIIYSEV